LILEKSLPLLNGYPNRVILTNGKHSRTLSSSPRDADTNWRMAWNWFRKANGKHIFRPDTGIPFGNFGLPYKTLRLFWKTSARENQT